MRFAFDRLIVRSGVEIATIYITSRRRFRCCRRRRRRRLEKRRVDQGVRSFVTGAVRLAVGKRAALQVAAHLVRRVQEHTTRLAVERVHHYGTLIAAFSAAFGHCCCSCCCCIDTNVRLFEQHSVHSDHIVVVAIWLLVARFGMRSKWTLGAWTLLPRQHRLIGIVVVVGRVYDNQLLVVAVVVGGGGGVVLMV